MPQFLTSKQRSAQQDARKSKPTPGEKEPREISRPLIIGGIAVCILLILFLFNHFVTRIVPTSGSSYTKVAPPPGYPDVFPYNTNEWQQQGHGRPLSGMLPPRLRKQLMEQQPKP